MKDLSSVERAVLRELSRTFPEGLHPYAEIAARAGVGEPEVLAAVRSLLERRIIRRMAAIAHDAKLGYEGNAMVAWIVEEGDLERCGEALSARPEISHAYARRTAPGWPYNFYTMIHSRSRDAARSLVEDLAHSIGVEEFRILYSVRELTKRPPAYEMLFDALEAGGGAIAAVRAKGV
jgi:DNA-binding Lrp family transcriptional regulator